MTVETYLDSMLILLISILLIIGIEWLYDFFKNELKNRVISFTLRVAEIIVTALGILSLITILKG